MNPLVIHIANISPAYKAPRAGAGVSFAVGIVIAAMVVWWLV